MPNRYSWPYYLLFQCHVADHSAMALGHGWDWYGSLSHGKPSGESNQSTAFLVPAWAGIYLLYITFGTLTIPGCDIITSICNCLIGLSGNLLN